MFKQENIDVSNVNSSGVYTAQVNIWDTDAQTGRCGHASISLQTNDETSVKVKKYMGLWPKYGFLVNPFTLPFVVSAVLHASKKDCEDREGDDAPIKPSKQFQIALTSSQHAAMKNEMNRISAKIENGTTFYTLFTNFNIFGFVKGMSKPYIMSQLHACPITGLPMDHEEVIEDCQAVNEIETDNCTTLAIKVLNAGGIDVKAGRSPWGLAPTTLGFQLQKLSLISNSISKKTAAQNIVGQ